MGISIAAVLRQLVLQVSINDLIEVASSGIAIDPSEFTLLDVHKWNTYHPHYKKYSRYFLYIYYTKLDSDKPKLKIQRSEVAEVKGLSSRQMDRLLRFHRLTHFGRLSSGFKYYARTIKLARSAAKM